MERALEGAEGGDFAPGDAHGGDLSLARKAFPAAPEPWLDLSTGVSPYSYPFRAPPPESWTRLPAGAELAALEGAAAASWGLAPESRVVAAPGTQAIISWLPHLFPARRVGVLGFTYFEHARVWAASGAAVSTVDDVGQLEDKDVAVIVNPNNPDGRIVAPDRLGALADTLQRRGKLLVVDEAFADFLPSGVGPREPSSCALSARPMACPGFDSVSPSRRRMWRGSCARRSAAGRSRAPPSPSASRRFAIRRGSPRRARSWRRTLLRSTRSSPPLALRL